MKKELTAPAMYKKHNKRCRTLLRRIDRELEDYVKTGEKITYAHSGSLTYVEEQLENICEFLNIKK